MIIVGTNFGDEGKGLVTSFLCQHTNNPLVVRFNGGHQAGHTVYWEGKRHVFSNFGSGTLQGFPTYWSEYCTFNPISFVHEYTILSDPEFYIHPLCAVVTPFDILFNQQVEKIKKHGSVGVGFGATIQRQLDNYKLFVQDLFYDSVLKIKLKAIAQYYNFIVKQDEIESFVECARKVRKLIVLSDTDILFNYNPIFEGAQGILLDMDFGFFPNVTRSNTTSKNALSLYPSEEIYYVTRTYLTRHGNGFMPNEKEMLLVNTELETNRFHPFQGEFRKAELDIELLKYSLGCDSNFSKGLKKNLIVTCMDQYAIDIERLISTLGITFNKVFVSSGPSLTHITQIV
jgi:adenylosuccinate synthase